MKTLTSVILLAGGFGSRMHTAVPKQYLNLGDKPVVRHSFDIFLDMLEIDEIIVVCSPEYQYHFHTLGSQKIVRFALPGERRQDSVYQGLQATTSSHSLICIHDGARPFIDRTIVLRALEAGSRYGAATVGMPIKFTVKESDQSHFVVSTPDRTHIWEIQTPQVVQRDILEKGFQYAITHKITVTDDVSLAELIGKPVKLIEGSYANLKITVPADLAIANYLIPSQAPQICLATSS